MKKLLTPLIILFWLFTGCSLTVDSEIPQNPDHFTRYTVSSTDPARLPPNVYYPVPQFILFSYEDNHHGDGVQNIMEIYKDRMNTYLEGYSPVRYQEPARATFYVNPAGRSDSVEWTADQDAVQSWKDAHFYGHEIANHTWFHENGKNFTTAQWKETIQKAHDYLNNQGIAGKTIKGFRAPFLEYNANMYRALTELGYFYDTTITDGISTTHQEDGSTMYWPFTLANGLPGDMTLPSTGPAPGLKVVPNGCLIDPLQNKIPGDDYHLWFTKGYSKEQFVNTLKNSLLLKYNGNRSPMNFMAHSGYYSEKGMAELKIYDPVLLSRLNTSVTERLAAVKEFLDYAQTLPHVQIVTTQKALEWVNNPHNNVPAVMCDINVTATPGGTVSPLGQFSRTAGSVVELTITPDPGYTAEAVIVDGVKRDPSLPLPQVMMSGMNIEVVFREQAEYLDPFVYWIYNLADDPVEGTSVNLCDREGYILATVNTIHAQRIAEKGEAFLIDGR